MGKYQPLTEFLKKQTGREVRMSFAQIERVIGCKLPPVARYRAWWSNSPTNNVMTKAWLEAGFRSEQVDMATGRLVFRRNGKQAGRPRAAAGAKPGQHPLFGCMKGTVYVPEGVDLTAPADPEWGDLAFGDDLPERLR